MSPLSPAETLREVRFRRRVIQEFCPLADSLECQLADIYWSVMGLQPFVHNDVPYLINNSGSASADAAAVLLQNCKEAELGEGPIEVLEIGAGSGLFARFLLDAFRLRCVEHGYDFYDRLLYHVTDRSPRTVAQWRERNLFEGHAERVRPVVCDAMCLAAFDQAAVDEGRFRAIVANYVLDVLPATIIRHADGQPQELQIRTYITSDASHTPEIPTLEQLQALIESSDPTERARLIDIVSMLEFETKYVSVDGTPPPYLDRLSDFTPLPKRMVLNYGAIRCAEECMKRLQSDGFLLVNDYGPQSVDEFDGHSSVQRFGISLATGLAFPFVDWHLDQSGYIVCQPEADPERQIYARLISRKRLPETTEAFCKAYGKEAYTYFRGPVLAANQHVQAGQYDDALTEYATAMERNPLDWHLIGQVAEFVGLRLQNFDVGAKLCREAIELNPTLSAWLWNVYGDCVYCLEDFDEAHQAYEQALQIDPQDARTHLNLVFTHQIAGRYHAALQEIASGMASDRIGAFRSQFLEKQHQIVNSLSQHWIAEQDRLLARMRVFS